MDVASKRATIDKAVNPERCPKERAEHSSRREYRDAADDGSDDEFSRTVVYRALALAGFWHEIPYQGVPTRECKIEYVIP